MFIVVVQQTREGGELGATRIDILFSGSGLIMRAGN